MRPVLSIYVACGPSLWWVKIELPAGAFVKPVDGADDLFAFQYDFLIDGKALEDGRTAATVTEIEDGDLLIEGYAAVFDGIDRQDENFIPGAFQRGIKGFLAGSSPLCFQHKHDHVLGKVLELEEVEGKGLRMKARVDGAIKEHPVLGPIYHQIRRGTISALSVGGFFKRKLTEAGWRIADMDFVEVSATATPVHPGTKFAVVAGKALEDIKLPAKPEVDGDIRAEDENAIRELVGMLDNIFTRIGQRGAGKQESSGGVTVLE